MEFVPIFIEPWGKLSQDSLLFKRIFKESFDEAATNFMNLFKVGDADCARRWR